MTCVQMSPESLISMQTAEESLWIFYLKVMSTAYKLHPIYSDSEIAIFVPVQLDQEMTSSEYQGDGQDTVTLRRLRLVLKQQHKLDINMNRGQRVNNRFEY